MIGEYPRTWCYITVSYEILSSLRYIRINLTQSCVCERNPLMSLTSPVLLTEVGEPPDVAQANTEPQHREEELDWAVPGDPVLGLLEVHGV